MILLSGSSAKTVLLTLVLLLPAPSPAGSPPDLKVPPSLQVEGGDYVIIRPETAGKVIKWKLAPGAVRGLSPFPSELVRDPRVFVATAKNLPGKYCVLFWTAVGDEPSDLATCEVEVLGPPTPPTPPGPSDPLAQAFQGLYALDADPQKTEHIKALAALYRQAQPMVDDQQVKTTADLLAVLRKASGTLLPSNVLLPIRGRIQEELQAVFGQTPKALDASLRAQAKDLFRKLATALESVR